MNAPFQTARPFQAARMNISMMNLSFDRSAQPSPTRRAQEPHAQAGFSLVELAIVLIIIGLIVGGVLKGQDLIESARVNSIQMQLNEIRVASSTFLNKYDALPGDMPNPELFEADTDSAGDGNGRVDVGDRINAEISGNEPIAFWWHLIRAGLIGGINMTCTDTDATDGISVSTCEPMSPIQGYQARVGGLYTMMWDDVQGNAPSNHWIVLGGAGTDAADTFNSLAVLTPTQLRTIDQRSDDGRPGSGLVLGLGDDGSSGTAVSCAEDADNTYRADDLTIACYAAFRL